MATPASSNSNRTSFGKYLIRAATRAGRLVNQLEASVLHSPMLASVPFGYRRLGMQIVKVILLLAVASVAFFPAVGMVALWAFAAQPIEAVMMSPMYSRLAILSIVSSIQKCTTNTDHFVN